MKPDDGSVSNEKCRLLRDADNCLCFVQLTMTQWANQSGWTNSASFQGCSFSWSVNKSATNLFGQPACLLSNNVSNTYFSGVDLVTNSTQCSVFTSVAEPFRPVIFWFFTYQPTPMASITMCTPNITLLDVHATIDLASGNMSVLTLGKLGSGTGTDKSLTQYAGNVTAAYNGMFFDVATSDPFVAGRQDAIRLSLPAAVFQAAQQQELTEAFQNNHFAALAEQIYVCLPTHPPPRSPADPSTRRRCTSRSSPRPCTSPRSSSRSRWTSRRCTSGSF